MCGIAGVYDLRGDNRIQKETVIRMIEKIKHRGPDGTDTYIDYNIALGFVRLGLIDLDNGMQPIVNEDGNIILICNGEIYNYKELRYTMEQRGHRFRTHTDVEVILHLYEEYETEFLNQLNGQFAFAIYDKKKKKLFCARDQVGITPFFYTIIDGLFIFASEIKAILEHERVERKVDLVAMDQMFTFPGIVAPRTMFKNINSLEHGHYLLISNERVNNVEYWDLEYPSQEIGFESKDIPGYVDELEEILKKSIKARLHADVPVGFYLSGGLDSSLIAYYADKYIEGEKNSFSINFPDKRISEAESQILMVNQIGSAHTESMITPKSVAKLLPKAIYHSETPLKETYNTASYVLSESVHKKNMKAVLTGEGADELFGGYVGYKFDKIRGKYKKEILSEEERRLRYSIWGDENFFYERNFTDSLELKRHLYSGRLLEEFNEFNCLNHQIVSAKKLQNVHITNKRSYIDFKLRLPEHLLADHGDRMCYANSIEARYPFLDLNVIKFASQMPPELKLHNLKEKYILKELAKNKLPNKIINRPKFAFVAQGTPELLQLREKESEYIYDILSYDRLKRMGFFNPDYILQLVHQYEQPGYRLNLPFESDLLIIVITFALFLEEFHIQSH
jgi:asparagine synthase (glutamine-hydrolysing)